MLESHPPHHSPNMWRDFFIHMATIVLGLIIAVGLEQTVEAIHHARELRPRLAHPQRTPLSYRGELLVRIANVQNAIASLLVRLSRLLR